MSEWVMSAGQTARVPLGCQHRPAAAGSVRGGPAMNTRPLTVDRMDAWAIHDCLQAALAGFGGRHESAEPWHGTSLLAKLRSALLCFESPDAPSTLSLDLTTGELECIDFNVPRTAYQG